jgi:hypothetical protein
MLIYKPVTQDTNLAFLSIGKKQKGNKIKKLLTK